MGQKKMFGKVTLAEQDYKEVISLAKEGVLSRSTIRSLKQQLKDVTEQLWSLEDKFEKLFIRQKTMLTL